MASGWLRTVVWDKGSRRLRSSQTVEWDEGSRRVRLLRRPLGWDEGSQRLRSMCCTLGWDEGIGQVAPTLEDYTPLGKLLQPPPAIDLGEVWEL